MHDHGLRIRKLAPSHIATIIALADENNLNPWTAQNYLDELLTPRSVMLVLEDENAQTVGFIVGRVVASANDGDFDAEVYNIAVAQKERGKGRGQLLFDSFMKTCQEHPISTVWLEVRESNRRAIDFYHRNGFEPVQKRNNFYRNPDEHAILMRLLLKKQTS